MELQLAIDLLNKEEAAELAKKVEEYVCLLYTSPSPRD